MRPGHDVMIIAASLVVVGCDSPTEQAQQAPPTVVEVAAGNAAMHTASSPPMTPSGFLYPVNSAITGDGNFGFCGLPAYQLDKRHTGIDVGSKYLSQPKASPVFAIANGTIIDSQGPSNDENWGKGNYALAVRHETWKGAFVAIYGHLRNPISRKSVVAGDPLGEIGPFVHGPHLHFGIYDGRSVPSPGWGRISDPGCRSATVGGFVRPIEFITSHSPKLDPPTNVSASDGSFTGYVRLTWTTVPGASSYAVFRSSSRHGAYALTRTVSGTTTLYDDFAVTKRQLYFYRVAASNQGGTSKPSRENVGFSK
jgi:murein DD-endopeptidase MepM/ murein hydrolase activator NlpD